MPSYFYHVKFELYPTPNPVVEGTANTADNIFWLPPSDASVFDELPSHARTEKNAFHKVAQAAQSDFKASSYISSQKSPESSSSSTVSIIDCGASPRAPLKQPEGNIEIVSERQWLQRQNSLPAPSASAAIRPETAVQDWRFGRVRIETIPLQPAAMAGESSRTVPTAAPELGPTFPGAGTDTRAEFVPIETKNTELGWGLVHFYRDGEETQGMGQKDQAAGAEDGTSDEDYTTLCLPAVPATMSPDDFVAFLGSEWLEHISHCRMVLTSNLNRNLILLKFRDGKKAKEWRKAFDGFLFTPSVICHAVFVKSITFETPTRRRMSHNLTSLSSSLGVSSTLRPFPPPTPKLVELPTCPVCLERMDDTNGLMTTPCSHIFHCTCLKNWKKTKCPVCRFTLPPPETDDLSSPSAPFGSTGANMCTVCDCVDDLWICLICGYVGCGRYKGGHAKEHWKDTAHCFSLEMETQHVWDYAGDMWVHRLIRDKGDGKVVELPSRGGPNQHEDEDVVPRAKLESIGLEYTHLLQSQLESQRAYYEEMINKTVDKASMASAAAEDAVVQISSIKGKTAMMEAKYETLAKETIPQLERDVAREHKKALKSEDLARSLSKSLQEEKRISEGLMKRVDHMATEDEARAKELEQLRQEVAELKEMNRDLTMFISGQEKLKELESRGEIEEGEIEGGTASVPEKKTRRRKK